MNKRGSFSYLSKKLLFFNEMRRRESLIPMPSIRFHEKFTHIKIFFFAASSFLLDKTGPKYRCKKSNAEIEIIPGCRYGKYRSPEQKIAFPATGFHTFGLNATRTIDDTRPAIIPEMAPVVLKRLPIYCE